jgi:hypothetical protein
MEIQLRIHSELLGIRQGRRVRNHVNRMGHGVPRLYEQVLLI